MIPPRKHILTVCKKKFLITYILRFSEELYILQELLDMGALTLIVPGNLPIGCSTAYLTYFMTSDKEEYDPQTGCLIWLNKFAEYHNTLLQTELTQIQALHPHANIIYADYYNAAMPLFLDPKKFGTLNPNTSYNYPLH